MCQVGCKTPPTHLSSAACILFININIGEAEAHN